MTRRTFGTIAALLALAAGCGRIGARRAAGESGRCKVAFALVTNLKTESGRQMSHGAELARDEINAEGGVAGCALELTVKSDDDDDDRARRVTKEAAATPGLVALLGTDSASTTVTAMAVAEQERIPFLVPATSAGLVTELGRRWGFRLATPDHALVAALFDFLEALPQAPKLRTVGVAYPHSASGLGRFVSIEDEARRRGIAIVAAEEFAQGTRSFEPLMARMKRARPDVLLLDANHSEPDELPALLREALATGVNAKLVLTTASAFSDTTCAELEHVFGGEQWSASLGWHDARGRTSEALRAAYTTRFGEAPGFRAASSYASVYVLKEALEAARRGTAVDVAKLADLRADLRAALRSLDLPNTVFGPVRFDSSGQNAHPAIVAQVQGGARVTIYPAALGAQRPVIDTMGESARP